MKAALPESLKGKFNIVGNHANHIESSYGTIRFSSLTEARAELLIAKGCPFLQKLPDAIEKNFDATFDSMLKMLKSNEPENTAEEKSSKKEKKAPVLEP